MYVTLHEAYEIVSASAFVISIQRVQLQYKFPVIVPCRALKVKFSFILQRVKLNCLNPYLCYTTLNSTLRCHIET